MQMSVYEDFGCRIKEYYGRIPKTKLMRRGPVIIRMKVRHSIFCKVGGKRSFDDAM